MPLMEVVLQQTYYGQICVNRWNYMASGTPASVTHSFALLKALGFIPTGTTLLADTVGAEIQNVQNTGVTFDQAMARAIYIDEDFFDNPFYANTTGATGAADGRQSPINAFGFRSSRVKQSIGRGYKRFVGTSDELVGAGGQVQGGGVAAMAAIAEAMSATLTYDDSGNTLTYTPCIVQKEKYDTPSGKVAYKYYATELLQAPHIASGIAWEPYDVVRSQTSRQYGRGS